MLSEYMVNMPLTTNPMTLFRQAAYHGKLHQVLARLTRRCFCLRDLDETLKESEIEGSHYVGLKTVKIDRIRGTQGKADAFDAEFNPIQKTSCARWLDIAREKLRGHDMPPVELVQVGDIYYVRDGHHRISVSRTLGQSFIDAEVTVMQLQKRAL
jgi:hypothetical protein